MMLKLEKSSDYFSDKLSRFLYERLNKEDYELVLKMIDLEHEEYCDSCDRSDCDDCQREPQYNEGYL